MHFGMDFSDNIFIGIAHVCKTGFEIRCGFLRRQMRAVRVTAALFDLVFVWISSYKAPGRRQLYRWTSNSAVILLRFASLGSLRNLIRQILGW